MYYVFWEIKAFTTMIGQISRNNGLRLSEMEKRGGWENRTNITVLFLSTPAFRWFKNWSLFIKFLWRENHLTTQAKSNLKCFYKLFKKKKQNQDNMLLKLNPRVYYAWNYEKYKVKTKNKSFLEKVHWNYMYCWNATGD